MVAMDGLGCLLPGGDAVGIFVFTCAAIAIRKEGKNKNVIVYGNGKGDEFATAMERLVIRIGA